MVEFGHVFGMVVERLEQGYEKGGSKSHAGPFVMFLVDRTVVIRVGILISLVIGGLRLAA